MFLKLFKKIFIKERSAPRDGNGLGIVTNWYNRGVTLLSKFLSKALGQKYRVLIFAHEEYVKDNSDWGQKDLVFNRSANPKKMIDWIKKRGLSAVFFPDRLEDPRVLKYCREAGVKTVMIMTYETVDKDDIAHYGLYDTLLCPVKCTYDLLKSLGVGNIRFVRWAVETSLFSPPKEGGIAAPIRFIHNAGWGGVRFRKNTGAAVKAFHLASRQNRGIRLVLKTQKPLKEYSADVRDIAAKNDQIIVNEKNLPLSDLIDLYRSCHVSLLPSKWEGIGLPFLESLSIGLPVITVDAPPMNEWVKNGYNGHCCRVAAWGEGRREDFLVKGALVDIDDYAEQILKFSKPDVIEAMRGNCIAAARGFEENFMIEIDKFTRSLIES